MRAIEAGALSVEVVRGSVSLQLVGGVATSNHPHAAGPFVEHGHVPGLASFDRQLLEMLFDHIAHEPTTDLGQLSDYRRAHPYQFWTHLKIWRESVDAVTRRLRSTERLRITRKSLDDSRGEIVDALYDQTRSDGEWSRMAELALVASLDDVVGKTAEQRWGHRTANHLTGPAGVVWLACLRSGKRTGADVLRRLFSPLRPSSYPPAQYTTLVLPPYRRVRIIDDGSLRLGG